MPNDHIRKEYGSHQYAEGSGVSYCQHGCGCCKGLFYSDGPAGIDPSGKCPKNPENGELLGGDQDRDYIIKERIQDLENRLKATENRLKQTEPGGEYKIADKLTAAQKEITEAKRIILLIQRIVNN